MALIKANTHFPYITTIIVFTALVIMLFLGFWQLQRMDEKQQRIAHIEQAKQQATLSLPKVISEVLHYQDYQAHATGSFTETLFYIDNKLHGGKPGFYVLAPFNTSYGVLMVNMGWIENKGARGEMPSIKLPSNRGELTRLEGIVYIPTNNAFVKETNQAFGQFPALLQELDLAQISQHLNTEVLPFVLRLLPNDSTDLVREWKVMSMQPEKHLAYAIQWFGLAVAGLTIFLISLRKRSS